MRITVPALTVAAITLFAGTLFADEITLKNGAFFEGTIVEETEDKVVLETDMGRITFRRAQIKSIRRKKAYKPPQGEPSRPAKPLDAPEGSVLVPNSKVTVMPPAAPWERQDDDRAVVFFQAPSERLHVTVFPLSDSGAKDFKEAVLRYRAVAKRDGAVTSETPYVCNGRNAYQIVHTSRAAKGLTLRDFFVDLEDAILVTRLSGHRDHLAPCLPAFWSLLRTLRTPFMDDKGVVRPIRPLAVGDQRTRVSYDPPVGPWRFKMDVVEGTKRAVYRNEEGGILAVLIGAWDGEGEMAYEMARQALREINLFDRGAMEWRQEKVYDLGRRYEMEAAADIDLSVGSMSMKVWMAHEECRYVFVVAASPKDVFDRVDHAFGAMRSSVTFEVEWSETLDRDRWSIVRFDERSRIRVPGWWPGKKGSWHSKGGSTVHMSVSPAQGAPPPLEAILAHLREMPLPGLPNAKIGSGTKTTIRGKTAYKITIRGSLRIKGVNVPVEAEFRAIFLEDRVIEMLIMAPDDGLDRQSMIFKRMLDSLRFD